MQVNATGNTLTPIFALNNNASDGTSLAVWGVLAYWSSPRGLMSIWPAFGFSGNTPGNDGQLNPIAAQIPGFTSSVIDTSHNEPITGIVYAADGRQWLDNGDIPLFILPPTWSVRILCYEPAGTFPSGAISSVTFLWGPYATAKLTQKSSGSKLKAKG